MTILQALVLVLVLVLVQGITEFLPISSSAHLILTPYLFGWRDQGLVFDVATNTGTLAAVMVYFRRDLAELTRALLGELFGRGAGTVEQVLLASRCDGAPAREYGGHCRQPGQRSKQVPEETRQELSDLEWRRMAGMRDRLIHGYFGVDYDLMWDVVHPPELRQYGGLSPGSIGKWRTLVVSRSASSTWVVAAIR